jgi:hypothetical protein
MKRKVEKICMPHNVEKELYFPFYEKEFTDEEITEIGSSIKIDGNSFLLNGRDILNEYLQNNNYLDVIALRSLLAYMKLIYDESRSEYHKNHIIIAPLSKYWDIILHLNIAITRHVNENLKINNKDTLDDLMSPMKFFTYHVSDESRKEYYTLFNCLSEGLKLYNNNLTVQEDLNHIEPNSEIKQNTIDFLKQYNREKIKTLK